MGDAILVGLMRTLHLDGSSLALDDLAPILAGEPIQLAVRESCLDGVRASRRMVDDRVERGDVVYGLTTGFGKLKNVAIPRADLQRLQQNLVLSHSVGVGAPTPLPLVRVAQVLRLNSVLKGVSGVRESLVRHLAALFNADFVPEVPQQGSVGASGDLAPLSHMVAAYMGFGHATVKGTRMDARAALDAVGFAPLVLEAKEGLALINGTEIMKAWAVSAVQRATNLSKAADAIGALTLEALQGSVRPFDDLLARLKNNEGQRRTAANVRACLVSSDVLASHDDCDRVQDPYSLRCMPQIHGAFKTALAHVREVIAAELNAVTDNPLVVPELDEVFSAGLFHGQPLSMVLDYIGLATCTLANVSERRIEQMVNPDLSRLPAFLTPMPGLHSGLMIAQYTAAALASENKVYAHPASVDTVPTSANQEDHVSMGMTAARKASMILDNVEAVLGIELVCGAQAREFHRDLRAGRGVEAAHACLREVVEPLVEDRFLHPDLQAGRERVASGRLVAAVEAAVGPLYP
ncbi:MAG: histidine ammonia-lyase [Planctomycetota bacterium]